MSDDLLSSPNPRIISSTISLSIYSITSLGLGLASTILITHNFPSEVFGVYTLILVVITFLGMVSTLGIETSVPRFIAAAADEASKEQFLSGIIFLRVALIFVTGILAWFGTPVLTKLFGQSLLPKFMLYALLLFALESFRGLLRSVLQGCFNFSKIGISDLILSLSNIILLIGFIFGTDRNVYVLILIKALSSISAIIFAYLAIPIRKRLTFSPKVAKNVIGFGLPLQINDILGFIFLRIDTLVVAAFLGPTNIALYEVARKIPDALRSLYNPFRSVYYPILARMSARSDESGISEFLSNAVRIISFVTLFGAAITFLFGQEIIRLLFSEKYLPSAPIFALLMVNLSFALIGNIMGTTIVALGDSKKPMIINSFNAAASWIGAILLVPIYALMGAALATTIGTALAVPLNIIFLRRLAMLKKSAYLKPILLFSVWIAIVAEVHPTLLWVKGIFLIAFLLTCGLLAIFTHQDLAFLVAESRVAAQRPLQILRTWVSRP